VSTQLYALGDGLQLEVPFPAVLANTPHTLTAWLSAPWAGGVQSYIGLYNIAGDAVAVQIGTREDNICHIWNWGGLPYITSTLNAVLPNQLTHVCVTSNGSTHRLIINGVVNATVTSTRPALELNTLYVNGFFGGGSAETATYIADQVEVFNRELTLDEINILYRTKGMGHGINDGRVLGIFFQGPSGTEISSIPNIGPVSNNLISNSTRTPKAAFIDSTLTRNFNPPV